MSALIQDLRYAFRTLVRERTFSLVAICTLAVALGANSAIFTIVNGILLEPLPYAEPDRLVKVRYSSMVDGGEGNQLSYLNIADLRTLESIEDVAAYSGSGMFLMEGEEPELLYGTDVEANMFPILGVKPALGRWFTAAEDVKGAEDVLLISHDLWRRRFNSDPTVVSRTIRMGSAAKPWRVVGVMPEDFKFPAGGKQQIDFYTPLMPGLTDEDRQSRGLVFLDAVARLAPGATLEQARAEATALAQRLERDFPASNTGFRYLLPQLHEAVVQGVKRALLILFVAVAAVLLIACANVANLLLARAAARHKEMSLRSALGATRGRIIRQLLVESVLLSALAGAAGLLLAAWGVDALLALAPPNIPRLDRITLDGRVVGFTLGLSVLTGIVFGLAPALAISKTNLTDALKEGTRGSTEGLRRNRIRNVLVTASVALSLVLLAGAGLLLRSFVRVSGINPGFDYANAAVLTTSPRPTAYKTKEEYLQFHERLRQEFANIPGVTAVGAADIPPMSGGELVYSFSIEGRPPFPVGRGPSVTTMKVTPGFFRAMSIPILRGREVQRTDVETSPPVVVVSRSFVERFFPDGDALGKRLNITNGLPSGAEIVGIAEDIRFLDLTTEPVPMFYVPHAQVPSRTMSIIVRGPNAESLGPSLRAAVRRLDPQQPIIDIESLREFRDERLAQRKFSLTLLTMLSVIALLLAAVGIYSIMSYSVAQRTSEIGIRMSLGAEARDIFRLIVGHAVRLVGIGVVIGLVAAFAATRVMASLLYGVTPGDPATFAAICVLIATVAVVASWIPARRAARVDPLVAIRYD